MSAGVWFLVGLLWCTTGTMWLHCGVQERIVSFWQGWMNCARERMHIKEPLSRKDVEAHRHVWFSVVLFPVYWPAYVLHLVFLFVARKSTFS